MPIYSYITVWKKDGPNGEWNEDILHIPLFPMDFTTSVQDTMRNVGISDTAMSPADRVRHS